MASGNGQPRIYSIASETADGYYNGEVLIKEISDDPTVGGLTLDRIDTDDDDLSIYFASILSGPEIIALDAVVAAHQGTVTAANYRFWEDNPIKSTSLQVFQNAISRTPLAMAQGAYRLSWYCEMRMVASGALEGYGEMRFQVDGTTKGNGSIYHETWQPCSGWDRYWAQAGETPELTIDFRRQGGGDDTVEIRKLKIGIELMR